MSVPDVLGPQERLVLKLRELYESYGLSLIHIFCKAGNPRTARLRLPLWTEKARGCFHRNGRMRKIEIFRILGVDILD